MRLLFVLALLTSLSAQAKEIKTNEVTMMAAPEWLTESRVDAITASIQQKLEWATRRTNVVWYKDFGDFAKAHSLGPFAIAVTVGQGGTATVHMGPLVTTENFDETFGHELVHVIVIQKYKSAIPKWLEEGLANHYSKHGKVDYAWLAKQPAIDDVKNLAHPLKGNSEGMRYRYKASQALAEMLDKKCDLENLVRLSVGKKMEDYIPTACEIKDLNGAFKDWVQSQAKRATTKS